jgi:hypothetical protein
MASRRHVAGTVDSLSVFICVHPWLKIPCDEKRGRPFNDGTFRVSTTQPTGFHVTALLSRARALTTAPPRIIRDSECQPDRQ